MFEVEAKVPISKAEFKILQKNLNQEARFMGLIKKKDTYLDQPKEARIRIRKENIAHTLTLKRRQVIDGVESNIEMEWGISDMRKMKALLDSLEIQLGATKEKITRLYSLNGFLVELNEVKKLGYFLEVEKAVSKKTEVGEAKIALIKLFSKLGYSPNQFEKRPYMELLSHV